MHEFFIIGGERVVFASSTLIDPLVSLYFKAKSVWTYFNNLDQDKLPSPEELFKIAFSLYDNYSTPRAAATFTSGCQPNSSVVSVGEPWREEEDIERKPASVEADNTDTEQGEGEDVSGEDEKKAGPEKQKDAISAESEEFNGDRTLMRSAPLMYEALVSKEVVRAVTEGGPRRVYEGIKVSYRLDPNLRVLTTCSSCWAGIRKTVSLL